ncbi:hypothetical protein BJY01DRAFT_239715 [Aspergillus pseudoustus]|uniref:DUF7905 domain-containing protein n=1 Tax=Aspergillus pseudoustus TaxID=1810923 RepID=A0ABR4IY79_9EURO
MDHETSNAQEWQLPGYGRVTPKKKAASIIPRPETPTPQAPKLKPKNEPEPKKQVPPAGPKAATIPSKSAGPPRGAVRASGRGARGRGTNKGAFQSSRLFRDSPAKAKWRNGAMADGVVQLPTIFGTLKYEFFGAVRTITFVKKSNSGHAQNEVFEEISKRTNAYVNPPGYTDQVIYLWGEPAQVSAAQETIKAALAKCNDSNKVASKKTADWTKIRAYSENKEANAEFKERRETVVQELRKPPGPGNSFSEQLLFLWPKDGPSMNECLGPHLEFLDIIRAKFGCYLFAPKDLPGYIGAVGPSHDAMKQIAQRLRILWAESVAKSNVKTKIYIVEPPEPSNMKSEVVVKKENHLHKPTLQGNQLSNDALRKWQNRLGLIQSKNNARLLNAVENCLRGVAYVRGHLRMRVNLGTFVLENYQVPEDNKPYYDFEEFREMLLHEQTKGRLIPALKVGQSDLLDRCSRASHLIEQCDSSSNPLKSVELAYSVNFEFLGADKSMLRLEAEFAKSPGAQDYEITQRRWLRPRTGGQSAEQRPPLHVAVTDFGRSDWQLEIKSLEFYEASSIDTALKSFSHTIGFQRTANMGDISAKPERKVTFPLNAPVSRFVEKTALRYSLKGTDYIFEIARYDEYRRIDVPVFRGQPGATITGGISNTPFTSWGASIFGGNWDNLLGSHANLPIGHAANYSPSLAIFFPPKEPATKVGDEANGFWEFIDLIKHAAELLGPAQPPAWKNDDLNAVSQAGSSSASVGSMKNEATFAISSPTSSTGSAGMWNADLGTLF